MSYSSATAYMVIVIVALAEELLTSVWLVVISLSGMLLSAIEEPVSDTTDADDPASIITNITKAIKRISLFIAAVPQLQHTLQYSK